MTMKSVEIYETNTVIVVHLNDKNLKHMPSALFVNTNRKGIDMLVFSWPPFIQCLW